MPGAASDAGPCATDHSGPYSGEMDFASIRSSKSSSKESNQVVVVLDKLREERDRQSHSGGNTPSVASDAGSRMGSASKAISDPLPPLAGGDHLAALAHGRHDGTSQRNTSMDTNQTENVADLSDDETGAPPLAQSNSHLDPATSKISREPSLTVSESHSKSSHHEEDGGYSLTVSHQQQQRYNIPDDDHDNVVDASDVNPVLSQLPPSSHEVPKLTPGSRSPASPASCTPPHPSQKMEVRVKPPPARMSSPRRKLSESADDGVLADLKKVLDDMADANGHSLGGGGRGVRHARNSATLKRPSSQTGTGTHTQGQPSPRSREGSTGGQHHTGNTSVTMASRATTMTGTGSLKSLTASRSHTQEIASDLESDSTLGERPDDSDDWSEAPVAMDEDYAQFPGMFTEEVKQGNVHDQRNKEVTFSVDVKNVDRDFPAFLTQPIKTLHQAAVNAMNSQRSMRLSSFLASLTSQQAEKESAQQEETAEVVDVEQSGPAPGELTREWSMAASFKPTVNNPLSASKLFPPGTPGRIARSLEDLDPALMATAANLSSEVVIPEAILIYELLGEGGYGNVFSGTWKNQSVAVKHLRFETPMEFKGPASDKSGSSPDVTTGAPASFLKEVSNLASLSHPNLLRILGFFCDQNNALIVTELIESGCMTDVIALLQDEEYRETICNLRVRIAFDVAAGFSYLHHLSPPMIHRDLKSPNILLKRNGQAIIADFGLARFSSSQSMTKQVGTPYWMAPEILLGEDYDIASDVYSYAIVLYELATGHLPHEEISPMRYLTMMFEDPSYRPDIPSYVPEVWTALIRSCWAVDPRERPTFDEVLYYIDEHQDNMYFDIPPKMRAQPRDTVGKSHSTLLTLSSLSESMSRVPTQRLSSRGVPSPLINSTNVQDLMEQLEDISTHESPGDTKISQTLSDKLQHGSGGKDSDKSGKDGYKGNGGTEGTGVSTDSAFDAASVPRKGRRRRRRQEKKPACCSKCVLS